MQARPFVAQGLYDLTQIDVIVAQHDVKLVEYKFEGMDHNGPGSPFPVVPSLHNRDVHASGTMARFFLDNSR